MTETRVETPQQAATLYLKHVIGGETPTPSQLNDLIQAAKILKAYGLSGADLIDRVRLTALAKSLKPFEFTFRPHRSQVYRMVWVRYYKDLQAACEDIGDVLAREYPAAELESVKEVSR